MREIRTYGLMRGKSHHAPQKLRFGGYLAEGNPKGAQAGARQRLYKFLNGKSQRRYRLKYAETYYGELQKLGLIALTRRRYR